MNKDTDIIIIAGQSNALGLSPAPENRNKPFFGALTRCAFGLGKDENRFGLEMGAAEVLHNKNGNFGIIKYASDGTSLYDRWLPPLGEDFNGLIGAAERGLSAFIKAGFWPRVRALLWMQGENDAIYREQAKAYEENLFSFIAAVRKNLDNEIVFSLGETNPHNAVLHYAADVNAAKQKAANKLHNVFFIPTGDLTGLIDNYHYRADEELALGKRLAESALKAARS